MNDKNDPYQEGARGAHFTGSTVEDSLAYFRGKRDRNEGGGGGLPLPASRKGVRRKTSGSL